MVTSGIRLGSQAATTRGFGLKEFEKIGNLITSKQLKDFLKIQPTILKLKRKLEMKLLIYVQNFLFINT